MALSEYLPGERVPSSGAYEELSVFGARTGNMVFMAAGEELPAAPRGFTWRALGERSPEELRALADQYRRMSEAARTPDVRARLRDIAERLDGLADQRDRESSGGA